jgi:NAD(P)-dependent dehydrogenase (short-subunit alcohol dehydrogenase family)
VRRHGPLFVVGAGPGVGTAVARRFGREGHPVGLVARDEARLEATTRELAGEGIAAAYAVADVRDVPALRAAIDALEDRLGAPEALCVSPLPDVTTIRPVAETTAEDLADALALGVVGTAAAVGRVLPAMRAGPCSSRRGRPRCRRRPPGRAAGSSTPPSRRTSGCCTTAWAARASMPSTP